MPVAVTAETPQHQPFAWAGLYLHTPASYRLFRIDGSYAKGNLGLADDRRPKLELAWKLPRKRRFDPHRMIRQQLVRTLPRAMRAQADKHIQPVASDHFASLLRYTDRERRIDRCAGLMRRTGRLVEMLVHFRDDDEPDEALLKHTAASLFDQPSDHPQRWAFFGHRLTSPTGYRYQSAQLNIGDMSVRFTRADRPAASLSVRIIYTAALALQRRSMRDWLVALHREERLNGNNLYYLQRDKKGDLDDTIETSLGETLVRHDRLRRTVRSVRWKLPTYQRRWMIHDKAHDRLLLIRVADEPDRFEPTLQAVLDGLDWRESGEANSP